MLKEHAGYVVESAPVKAVLLDRDGVLNADLPTGVLRQQDLHDTSGSRSRGFAIARGLPSVGLGSNQACVGRGELAIDELARINAEIDAGVRTAGGVIDQWYIFPHRADEDQIVANPNPAYCRRRRRIMALSWRLRGLSAMRRGTAGRGGSDCWAILVRTGSGRHRPELPQVPAFDDLYQAAEALFAAQ